MFGCLRGCGCLMMVMMVLVLGVIALVIGWPWLTAWYVNGSLPKTWRTADGSLTLTAVSATPLADDPARQAHLTIPVGRLRDLASHASHRWIPPFSMRGGFSAEGTGSINDLGAGERPWQAESTWLDTAPLLTLRVPVADINRVIAARLALQSDSPLTRCALTSLHIINDDPADAPTTPRRFAIDAAAEVSFRSLGSERSVTIRHLGAFVHVRLTPKAGGWAPVAKLDITDLDVPMLNIPFIGQVRHTIGSMLEEVVNTSLAMRLAGVTVPDWHPIDLAIDARAVPDVR